MARRTTTRRTLRGAVALTAALAAGLLVGPTPATAAPTSADAARKLVEQAGAQLSAIDEQIQQAQLTVAEQQKAAAAAAEQAAVAQSAVDVYQPQLRAIAQTGYTAGSQSRIAALLTSDSAADLVRKMTTLDVIATHTNALIAQVAAAQAAAAQAKAAADQAAAQATAGLAQLQQQQAELKRQVTQYQADFNRLSTAQQAAVTAALAGPTLSAPPVGQLIADAPAAVATAIKTALAQVGKPYAYGSVGPNSFDCSGLTMYAYAAAGVSLPHSSAAQSRLGRQVSRSELKPGDLVYFYSPVSHVGLYIGNGMMVHARTYGSPVAVTSVDQSGYRGAVRIVG